MSHKTDAELAHAASREAACSKSESLAVAAAKEIEILRRRLLESMHAEGYWEGYLSSSALSTATAMSTLSLTNCAADKPRIQAGAAWLAEHAHTDGGWGDTADSPSNLATTLLVLAALKLAADAFHDAKDEPRSGIDLFGGPASGEAFASHWSQCLLPGADRVQFVKTVEKAVAYLKRQGLGPQCGIIKAVGREYGKDRTFAVPILMNCALAGFVNWTDIPGLPFELAIFPSRFYKALRLHVVSYAMPALIAIGLLLDRRHPPRNIFKRLVRRATASRVLKILRKMQPPEGGFLEAIPLTSFVAMSLTDLFGADQPAAADCLKFLRHGQRADGSWPIDSNLSVWLTTSAVVALSAAKELPTLDGCHTARWIVGRQYDVQHPFTHAAPGGWAWTHLAGGVPDADDTSGAILALAELDAIHGTGIDIADRVAKGIKWLLDLQNGDGGWPTFCRGWGKLPFDRSSPDITAHVLRALWKITSAEHDNSDCHRAMRKGLKYLTETQQTDGSWIPLWFGNQAAPDRTNPVVGTSFVLRALEISSTLDAEVNSRGIQYLLHVQNTDGGWGGAAAVPSTVEETALAVSALAAWEKTPEIGEPVRRGTQYLLREMENGVKHAQPIGLYFSHLWYAEKLYPLIWTLEALGRALFQGKILE